MTFSLRRKHPITARAWLTRAWTAIEAGVRLGRWASVFAGAFVGVSASHAQAPARPMVDPAVRRAAMQPPAPADRGMPGTAPDSEAGTPQIQLTPPGPDQLFGHLDTERQFQERLRQEALERVPPERTGFPEEPILSRKPFVPRELPPNSEIVEPGYVTFNRLYFEQKNFERHGWD